MATDPVLGFLEHYGVKGMHWGVRRKVGAGGRVVGKSKPKPSSDFKTTVPLRSRPTHSLSNMQLKKVNERMQLESKFNQMNPSRRARGKAAVNNILKGTTGAVGSAAIIKLASDPKNMQRITNGAKAVKGAAFKVSKPGRLLNEVAKGSYG